MRISDWSSDVCSSDLKCGEHPAAACKRDAPYPPAALPCEEDERQAQEHARKHRSRLDLERKSADEHRRKADGENAGRTGRIGDQQMACDETGRRRGEEDEGNLRLAAIAREFMRAEAHTSELQSLMRSSYDALCLKK